MENVIDASIDFELADTAAARVALVGFMGSGKTSLAERWANSGGPILWFDSDRDVLAALKCSTVTEAFAEHGEELFRSIEREVILKRSTMLERGVEVWSLGGGALLHPEVVELLRAEACVVWLDADLDVLWERVAGSDRPLARDRSRFEKLYWQRRAAYEQIATVRVDSSGRIEDLGLGRLLAQHLPPSWFGSGVAVGDGLIQRIDDLAVMYDGRPIAIVADRTVDWVADIVRERIEHSGRTVVSDLRVPMGEFNKQLSTVEYILLEWARATVTRDTVVVGVGGGTMLDAAGFAASIFFRGVDWVSVPTTLTSQVDAGIGGKTGVNLGVAKNIVGTVHMPRVTIIDPMVLSTLSEDAMRDGFVEAAKTALLAGEWLLDLVRQTVEAPRDSRDLLWRQLVAGCASYKDAVVAEDPFDNDGIRAQLNLGHTLAHAIESATGGAVSHGAAVAIGINVALRVSGLVLDAPESLVQEWSDLCMSMGIVTRSPISWIELVPHLALDKKRDRHGLAWVLLADLGRPVSGVRVPIEAVERIWDEQVCALTGQPSEIASSDLPEIASARRPRILVLFGVNLGLLGVREQEHYGSQTLPDLVRDIEAWASVEGLVADCRQTDSLERFLHALHEARLRHHAVIVNPGAWTHHEHSIRDALSALSVPRVEIHLSKIENRESWRQVSVVRDVVDHVEMGKGAKGYRDALRWVRSQL